MLKLKVYSTSCTVITGILSYTCKLLFIPKMKLSFQVATQDEAFISGHNSMELSLESEGRRRQAKASEGEQAKRRQVKESKGFRLQLKMATTLVSA